MAWGFNEWAATWLLERDYRTNWDPSAFDRGLVVVPWDKTWIILLVDICSLCPNSVACMDILPATCPLMSKFHMLHHGYKCGYPQNAVELSTKVGFSRPFQLTRNVKSYRVIDRSVYYKLQGRRKSEQYARKVVRTIFCGRILVLGRQNKTKKTIEK